MHVKNVMYIKLKPLITWLEREILYETMPMDFRGGSRGGVAGVATPPPTARDTPPRTYITIALYYTCTSMHTTTVVDLTKQQAQG